MKPRLVPGEIARRARKGRAKVEAPASPDPAVDAVDGASTPSVQRKLGELCRQERIGDRSIQRLCSWAILIAEVDEKRLVGRNLRKKPPETTFEAGRRWQSRRYGGGLSVMPRVLVEGRRLGFGEAIAFDEAAVEAEPGGRQRGLGSNSQLERGDRDRGRQRRSCMLGARPKKPPAGGTVWRSAIKLHQDQAVLEQAEDRATGSST